MTDAEAAIATNSTAIATNAQSIADSDTASSTFRARTDNPHSVTAAQVGLGDVAQGDYSGQGMRVKFESAGNGEHVVVSDDYVVFALAGANIVLPEGSPSMKGRILVVKSGDLDGGGEVDVTPHGDQLIDGAGFYRLTFSYSSITLVCAGVAGWMII